MVFSEWSPPPRRKSYLAIAFPSSVIDTEHTLGLKTLKVGVIARATAIHRVDEIIVYTDKPGYEDKTHFIVDILEYLSVPPYLRRKIIPKKPTLKYVGLLPPLKTPSHIKTRTLKNGEFRDALFIRRHGKVYAYVGVGRPIPVKGRVERDYNVGPVKLVIKKDEKYAIPVRKEEIPYYWGFSVSWAEDLGEVLSIKWDLRIATSRLGEPIGRVWDSLADKYFNSKRTLIAFGSPTEGLWTIAGRLGIDLKDSFDFIINFIPSQGVETVRTEEAIMSVLEYFTLLDA